MRRKHQFLVGLAGAFFTMALPAICQAATITVDSLADPGASGICVLRDAIAAANTETAVNGCVAGTGDDTIVFSVTGTITLGSTLTGNPGIVNTLTIQGPPANPPVITIDGPSNEQVMGTGPTGTLNLNNITIAHSGGGITTMLGRVNVFRSLFIDNVGEFASALNDIGGAFTVTSSNFINNRAPTGTIVNNDGTLEVSNSTFVGNSAVENDGFAGVISDLGGTSTVTNSTFTSNTGRGISNGQSSTLTVANSTFTSNTGDGIENDGTADIKGSILADNSGGNCFSLPERPLTPQFTDDGYNLSDDDSCGFTQSTSANNVTDAELNLDPAGLQNNGGPTQTIALESTSVAINKIPVADCTDQSTPPVRLATDQRGVIRPQFTACDIGAYEYDTAHSLKTAALSAIENTTGGNAADNSALKLASSSLAQAVKFYWIGTDGNHLSPAAGILDFLAEERAVSALAGTLIPSSQLPAATIENYLFNILLADRTLAVVAITDAGGDADASQLVATGDAQAAAGDYLAAVISYQKAWSLAVS